MPTYQYACTDCDHAFEQVQSFSDDSLTTCPACEGRLRKIFNAVGVVFKGSGFYRTDSRAEAKSGSGASAGNGKDASKSEPAAKSESSTSAKTESKSEPKTTSGAKPGAKTESRSAAGAA